MTKDGPAGIDEAREFRIDFWLNDAFPQIERRLDSITLFDDYSLLGRPFNGIFTIRIDGRDIVRVRNLENVGAVLKINYPLAKIQWPNNHFRSLLTQTVPDYENREWTKEHVFTYPHGDYSPDIPMHFDGKHVIIEWTVGQQFEYPTGTARVPPRMFGEEVLRSVRQAVCFFSFFPSLQKYETFSSFESNSRDNRKWFDEEYPNVVS